MAINPDIRDQAYQFFIEEAPELLQAIEAGLLTLRQERNTGKVHDLMRSAHSLKGGAASVELEAIKTLAHRLENIFKALYNETIDIDTDFESQLLQAYDCLRLPLMEQIETGYFDAEQALAIADPIFAQIEELLGDALHAGDTYIPSSSELGIDLAKSIFEVDVAQGLEHLTHVVANPLHYEVAGELRAQAEVFAGFAELLNQPEFGAIANITLAALEAHPERALLITQLALTDFQCARQAILSSHTQDTNAQNISPSPALLALAQSSATKAPDFKIHTTTESIADTVAIAQGASAQAIAQGAPAKPIAQDKDLTLPSLDDIFSTELEPSRGEAYLAPTTPEVLENTPNRGSEESIEDIFANAAEFLDQPLAAPEVSEDTQDFEQDDAIDEIFASAFELLEEGLAAPQVSEDTQNLESEEAIAEIFANAPELLDERSVAFEVLDNTVDTDAAEALDELFDLASELFDEHPADMDVSEDTQNLQPAEVLEQSSARLEPLGSTSLTAENTAPTSKADADTEAPNLVIENLEVELAAETTSVTKEAAGETASVEEIVDTAVATPETEAEKSIEPPETLEEAVQSIEEMFDELQTPQEMPALPVRLHLTDSTAAPHAASLVPAQPIPHELSEVSQSQKPTHPPRKESNPISTDIHQRKASPTPTLSVRVDSDRLERMNNLVGELSINRNGLSLQNEQLQAAVRELLSRFFRVQGTVGQLQELSDRMLVDRLSNSYETLPRSDNQFSELVTRQADFDSLELDSYGFLHLRLQGLLEDMVPLEESVDDIVLFARATDKTLEQQRQMLTQLRDELMWARMVPLGEVLNRFPRVLRDLSTRFHKSVSLKLNGTGVLVDKAALEKLYDPLLHLLRNAFDHGIELPEIRSQKGKSEQGQIEIKAYHQGSQTIIEVRDDGQGLDLERIGRRAVELGLLSAEQLPTASNNRLFELLFEPGFSTASQVTELSGRGVGLDVVRSQMRSLKGTITVTSSPGAGTTFTLHLPLTLSIAKLLVCFVGSTALALPSDSVEEIVIPKADQVKSTGSQRFLRWRDQVVPAYKLADLLEYNCPLPETSPSKALVAVASPETWALPMLVLRQEQRILALEIDRLVTEQELVIKPFGEAIAPPGCTYGCTILGDGSLIPVIDGAILLDQVLGQTKTAIATTTGSNLPSTDSSTETSAAATNENSSVIKTTPTVRIAQAPTVLVVDDAVALRRTLALTLERGGCRVLQARDGREAIEQLHQSSAVKLVVCDIEMPNMNGFEFLSYRRQDAQLSQIPVVMLTSRSNDKHRWLAMQLGANAYFTKPYLEQEFLAAIKDIISQTPAEKVPVLQPTV